MTQGMPSLIEDTNTMFFIDKHDIYVDRWKAVIHGRLVVEYFPEKINPYRTRPTVGGGIVNYPGDRGTNTVRLTTVKLLLKSIVSTINTHFVTIDIKDFYLNTPMARSEYMRLKLSDLPESVMQQYNMEKKATRDGYVHVDI